jgi:hypothetical protein
VKLDNGATVVLDVSWISHIEESNLVYTQLFGSQGGATMRRGTAEELKLIGGAGNGPSRSTMVTESRLNSFAAQEPGSQL